MIMKLYTFITILSLFFVSCDNDQWDTLEESDLVIQENKPLEDSENKYKDIYIKSTKSVVQIDLYSRDLSGIPDNKIGTGSGYQCAILYNIGVDVYTIERNHKLFRKTIYT